MGGRGKAVGGQGKVARVLRLAVRALADEENNQPKASDLFFDTTTRESQTAMFKAAKTPPAFPLGF